MKYVDLHCDTLTVCCDSGLNLADCDLQTSFEKLKKSGCAAQCFAVFTEGADAAVRFKKYSDFYFQSLKKHKIKAVLNYGQLLSCAENGETGAVLTVENLGFINELSEIAALAEAGVKMASLVWNYENKFAYPNLVFENGLPQFLKRNKKGLKPLGREAVKLLDENKIIIDISHLSDGGTDEILCGRKIPLVASHSNSSSINRCSRNLTDGHIKKIADCGGVVGVNFCKDFLGEGETFESVFRHIRRIVNVGGEDAVAFGSDFDGIPAPPHLEDCTKMPELSAFLESRGVKGGLAEKLCFKNFARVFKEVCG